MCLPCPKLMSKVPPWLPNLSVELQFPTACMEQPNGFKVKGKEDYVWMLCKGLYGLPQGSQVWNKTMHDGMTSIGFIRIPWKYCTYFRKTNDSIIITGIHVDNFLAETSSNDTAAKFKADLATLWEISDLVRQDSVLALLLNMILPITTFIFCKLL
jgi:hypothetical protein